MSDSTPRPVKCGNCGWTGYDGDEGMDDLAHCKALSERLDPGCTVPAGECVECGAFVYYTDQIARTRWRELADDAVQALKLLRNGDISDGDRANVEDIIQTLEVWEKIEAGS